MKTESGKDVSQIGIGSYGVGGRGHRDMPITEKAEDQRYIDALAYTLNEGANFTEIALGYGHGQSLALFKKALDASKVSREDIFLTHSLYPRDLPTLAVVRDDIAGFYEVMDTDYADSTLVTQSLIMQFGEKAVYPMLHDLIEENRTRYVSLSNASPSWVKHFKEEFGEKFVAHEGHLSFEVRALQDKGVFDTCDSVGVENIIWRPLRRNQTMQQNWPLLKELANKYQKTQSQIILNWISNLGYRSMVFSATQKHIDENIESVNFQMTAQDHASINAFRPQNYHPNSVDWEGTSIDDDIVGLVKDFEEHLG